MRKIFANYCVLATVYVPDNATEKEVLDAVAAEYEERGFDFYSFDDGEYEEAPMTKEEEKLFDESYIF